MSDASTGLISSLFSSATLGLGLSVAAAGLALAAFLWSRKALGATRDCLALIRAENTKADSMEVWKLRYELLFSLSNERAKLMGLHLELEALHAELNAEHPEVRAKVRGCTSLFEFQPRIEATILGLDSLYSRYMTLNPASGVGRFMELTDEQHKISEDAETLIKSCSDAIPVFKEKRHEAVRAQRWTTPPLEGISLNI